METTRTERRALFLFAVAVALAASVVQLIGLAAQPVPSTGPSIVLAVFALATLASALAVLWRPTRLFLSIAALVNLAALVLWTVTRRYGLPDGTTVWHPELLAVPDFLLPVLEGVAALLFLCLLARTFDVPPGARRAVRLLPWIALAGLLLWAVFNPGLAQVLLVITILDADVPRSLGHLFIPALILFVVLLIARPFSPGLRERTPHAFRTGVALLFGLLVLNVVAAGAMKSAHDTAWLSRDTPIYGDFLSGRLKTLAYCWRDGHPLAMDLVEPEQSVGYFGPVPTPVVFFIHGGETWLGSRALHDGSPDGELFAKLRNTLLQHGFAVGSIDYALSPVYPRADQTKDAKCAVRFLRAHARELNIDPNRIGVFGPSQGGYLSAMLGTVPKDAGFDEGEYPDQSSKVEAVVDMWGPMDLANFSGSPKWVSVLRSGNSVAKLHAASPLYYVAPGDPPFLIIQGLDDWFIAPHHSIDMDAKLRAANVPVALVLVRNNGHGLAAPTAGKTESPSPDALIAMIDRFFVQTLGGPPHARMASPQ
jgi:acetyl esterase/lipase